MSSAASDEIWETTNDFSPPAVGEEPLLDVYDEILVDISDSDSEREIISNRFTNPLNAGGTCGICGNLVPELLERPRDLVLSELQESSELGCINCGLLAQGFHKYFAAHGNVSDALDVSLSTRNSAGTLCLEIAGNCPLSGDVLEFYCDYGKSLNFCCLQ